MALVRLPIDTYTSNACMYIFLFQPLCTVVLKKKKCRIFFVICYFTECKVAIIIAEKIDNPPDEVVYSYKATLNHCMEYCIVEK